MDEAVKDIRRDLRDISREADIRRDIDKVRKEGMNSEELEVLKTRVLNEDTTSFGLTSSYKRLKILYGEAFTFDIESKPQEGTSISIQIPGKADIDNETIL